MRLNYLPETRLLAQRKFLLMMIVLTVFISYVRLQSRELVKEHRDLREKIESVEQQNIQLKQEKQDLSLKILFYQSDAGIETLAREKLRLVKRGEFTIRPVSKTNRNITATNL